MITRAEMDPLEETPDAQPSEPWLAALDKAASYALAMGQALEQLHQQFDQAAERWNKTSPPGAEAPESGLAAPPPVAPAAPSAVEAPSNGRVPSLTREINPTSDASASPGAPSEAESSAPAPLPNASGGPAIPGDTVQLAAQLGEMAQRFLSDQSSAAAIHESLAAALDLMTQAAAHAASQSEVQQIAAQVETLRGAVRNLQSRASISRAN